MSYSSHVISDETLDIFDNYYHLKQVDVPLQIIAATNDRVTPFDQAVQLYNVCRRPLPLIKLTGAGHNNCFDSQYVQDTLKGIQQAIQS
jgi:pimeloyl-ACP methyl ester carboxylesterase